MLNLMPIVYLCLSCLLWVVIFSSAFECHNFLIMPPTLIKLEGHIAFGLSVCVCVGVSGWVGLLTFER